MVDHSGADGELAHLRLRSESGMEKFDVNNFSIVEDKATSLVVREEKKS